MESVQQITFETLLENWKPYTYGTRILPYTWLQFQREFWNQVRGSGFPRIINSPLLETIPFKIRWALAERFPEYAKKLLIDTRSFEHEQKDFNYYRMAYDKDDLYVRQVLIPHIQKTGTCRLSDYLKPYIRSIFQYPIS